MNCADIVVEGNCDEHAFILKLGMSALSRELAGQQVRRLACLLRKTLEIAR